MSVRVPHLVGNTRLRDHSFWPTILRSELNQFFIDLGETDDDLRHRNIDQGWPVAVSLKTLMQLTWRVREWEISGGPFSYTGSKSSAGIPPPGSPTWTLSGTFEAFSAKAKRVVSGPFDLRDVTDERDLLGPYTDSFNMPEWKTLRNAGVQGVADGAETDVTRTDSDTGTDPGPFIEPHGAISFILFGTYVIYDPDTGLFYPRIAIDGSFRALFDFGGSTSGVEASFYCVSADPIAPPLPAPGFGVARDVPQGTLTITGLAEGEADIVIPLGMFGKPDGSAPPIYTTGGSGSLDLVMTPLSWWPFATKAGAPCYDENDGSQLADPFS